MSDSVVVPFVSAAEKLVEHAELVVNQLKATLIRNDPSYLLSEVIIDHYLKMRRLCDDKEFSHQNHIAESTAAFDGLASNCKWAKEWRGAVNARRNEIEALRKAKIAEERGQIKRYKYEDCGPNEYASYNKNTALPEPTFLNAQLVFRNLGITGSYNEMNEKKEFLYEGKEIHVGALRNLCWDTTYVDFPQKTLEQAIDAYCMRQSHHPVKDYFESIRDLANNGKHLIDNWLTVTLGAEDNALNREIGRKMICAMVARIYQPGTKFDNMIVFESSQGVGKSTLLEVLCGTKYFNSGKILTMESKEQMEHLKGRMIYESADLVGHGRADVDAVKAFLSATADRGRWAYATEVKDHPRTCIIVGTTNKNNYLLDETGNRRIWPVECCVVETDTVHDGVRTPKEANIKWLIENRDQLFAEAIALYESGFSLVMPRDMWKDVAALQEDRMTDIPLIDYANDVFAFTEFEGLFKTENKELLELRIFTKDIIENLFPNGVTNTVVGRQIKTAMLAVRVLDKYKWEYKKVMKIKGVCNSGYIMKIEGEDDVKETIEMIDARVKWRARKNISGATQTM